MDDKTAKDLAWTALERSVYGDAVAASDALDRIGGEGTPRQMFAVVQSWCGAAKAALEGAGKVLGSGDFVALEEVVPGTFAANPGEAFAARTLAAHLNGDFDTAFALFSAAGNATAAEYTNSVCHVLLLTSDIVRDCVGVMNRGGGA